MRVIPYLKEEPNYGYFTTCSPNNSQVGETPVTPESLAVIVCKEFFICSEAALDYSTVVT